MSEVTSESGSISISPDSDADLPRRPRADPEGLEMHSPQNCLQCCHLEDEEDEEEMSLHEPIEPISLGETRY